MEHPAGLRLQGFPDLLRAPPAPDHGFDVPQQMRPAQLPPPGGIPVVGAPAIRHQPAPEVLAQEFLRHLATARQPDRKDRHPAVTTVHSQARCCPSRHPVSSAYAAGWACT